MDHCEKLTAVLCEFWNARYRVSIEGDDFVLTSCEETPNDMELLTELEKKGYFWPDIEPLIFCSRAVQSIVFCFSFSNAEFEYKNGSRFSVDPRVFEVTPVLHTTELASEEESESNAYFVVFVVKINLHQYTFCVGEDSHGLWMTRVVAGKV
jgi:hypothetical protein